MIFHIFFISIEILWIKHIHVYDFFHRNIQRFQNWPALRKFLVTSPMEVFRRNWNLQISVGRTLAIVYCKSNSTSKKCRHLIITKNWWSMIFLMEKQSLKTVSLVHLQLRIRRPRYKFTLIQPHLNKMPEQTQKKSMTKWRFQRFFWMISTGFGHFLLRSKLPTCGEVHLCHPENGFSRFHPESVCHQKKVFSRLVTGKMFLPGWPSGKW